MHTVPNRIASRPHITKTRLTDFKPPVQRTSREELNLITGGGVLPEGPSMPCRMEPERVADRRKAKRRNPKGKKARKAAARKADAAAAVAANPALAARTQTRKSRKGKPRTGGPTALPAPPHSHPHPHPVAELEAGSMRDLCLQAEPALALLLPSRPEPLVEAPAPQPAPAADAAPNTLPPAAEKRVLSFAAMPELLIEPSEAERAAEAELALIMPDVPEPVEEIPASLTAPLAAPSASVPATAPALAALAAMADAHAAPLPRSRALVPARRQGLVDVIAFLLRDSGRRLARWSARRHKSRAEQAALRKAEARQLNLQRELEALDALRRHGG